MRVLRSAFRQGREHQDEVGDIQCKPGAVTLYTHSICGCPAELLDHVDLELPTVVLLAYLSITNPARDRLGEHRTAYAAKVRARLVETEPGRVDSLLCGLE